MLSTTKVILATTTQNSQRDVFGYFWYTSRNQLTLSERWQAFSFFLSSTETSLDQKDEEGEKAKENP